MGAAQSGRNRSFSRREFETRIDEPKSHFFAVLDHINSMPRGKGKPFGAVVIEPPTKKGDYWWLMRAGEDRHRHYAYCYRSLPALMAQWSLFVTGFTKDKAGAFYTTEIL